MICDFCGNPAHLAKLLFEANNKMGTDKPISDSHICDSCVRKAHKVLIERISQESKKFKAEYGKKA